MRVYIVDEFEFQYVLHVAVYRTSAEAAKGKNNLFIFCLTSLITFPGSEPPA